MDRPREALTGAARDLPRTLPRLGVELPGAAADELAAVGERLAAPGAPAGPVPGDTRPDNAVLAPDGVVASTPRAPSTATRRGGGLPAGALALLLVQLRLSEAPVAAALAAWRGAAAPALPAVTRAAFAAELDAAVVAWVLVSTAWLLPAALDGDPRPADRRRAGLVPRRRALLQHRAAVAADRADGGWPALAALARRLLAAEVAAWGEQPLALAPAFR